MSLRPRQPWVAHTGIPAMEEYIVGGAELEVDMDPGEERPDVRVKDHQDCQFLGVDLAEMDHRFCCDQTTLLSDALVALDGIRRLW